MGRKCCGNFYPKEVYQLDLKGYSLGLLELGFCPQCGAMVVEIGKKDYSNSWSYEKAKRKQALKLFNDNKEFITDSLTTTRIKHGNKSNMGFRYGRNVPVKNCKGKDVGVRQYAVDFNGTTELLKQVAIK